MWLNNTWSIESLKLAMATIELGEKIWIVAIFYNIPPNFLSNHIYKHILSQMRRSTTILIDEKEKALEIYMI